MDDPIGVEQADARLREIRPVDPLGPKLPPIAITTAQRRPLIGLDLELPDLEILGLDRDHIALGPGDLPAESGHRAIGMNWSANVLMTLPFRNKKSVP